MDCGSCGGTGSEERDSVRWRLAPSLANDVAAKYLLCTVLIVASGSSSSSSSSSFRLPFK